MRSAENRQMLIRSQLVTQYDPVDELAKSPDFHSGECGFEFHLGCIFENWNMGLLG